MNLVALHSLGLLIVGLAASTSSFADNTDFIVGRISADHILVAQNSTNTGRPSVLQINYSACLQNSADRSALLNHSVTITSGRRTRTLSTDNLQGCLQWQENISFDYFSAEHYLLRTIRFGSQTIQIYVNPWQYENNDLAVLDARYSAPPRTLMSAASTGNAQLLVSDMNFSFVGRDFTIDNDLALSSTRHYRVALRPIIRRLTAMGWQDEAIGNSRLQLQVLLESEGYNNLTPRQKALAMQTVEITSNGPSLISNIALKFQDLRLVLSRNRISIRLSVVGSPNLRSEVYSGSFEAVRSSGTVVLLPRPTDDFDSQLAIAAQKQSATTHNNSIELFRSAYRLNYFRRNVLNSYDINALAVENLVASPNASDATLAKLCRHFYPREPEPNMMTRLLSPLASCRAHPRSHIAIRQTEHLLGIRTKPVVLGADNINLSIRAAFNISQGSSWEWSSGSSLSLSARAQLGLELLGNGATASIGNDIYTSVNYARKRGRSTSIQTSSSITVNAEQISFGYQAAVAKCLVLTKKQHNDHSVYNGMLCSARQHIRQVRDSYYYMYLFFRNSESPLQDAPADLVERPWTFVLRGAEHFHNFSNALQDQSSTITLERGMPYPETVLQRTLGNFDGMFPGLVSIH